jgi:hypothetical protein
MPIVELRGNANLRKALRSFAPDLEKQLKKELTKALKPVVKKARSFVPSDSPMSGWGARSFSEARFPFYNANTIIRGIGYSTAVSKRNKNGFTSMARIFNNSPVGAIYETAGRKGNQGQPWVGKKASGTAKNVSRSTNPNAGKQFISNLVPLTTSLKGRGRLIYRAWAESRGVAEGAAMKAIDKAVTQFKAKARITKLSKAA